jgi:CDP-4-dehydro-6-deoxyglucose reductase, E3
LPRVEFEGASFLADAGETVLDVLCRHAVPVPYSCRKGICQACLLRSESGAPPAASQRGLREALRERGYFLACQCLPRQDMRIARAEDAQRLGPARVARKELLGPTVCRLVLQARQPFDYRAGQFVNLRRDDGTVRSYSLASVPGLDRGLELHVRRHRGGRMSGWIFDQLAVGDEVELLGPLGECHYRPGFGQQPLLMVGTGTGLAPLMGIARDALQSGHRGPVYLYHGSSSLQGLYGRDALQALAGCFANFHYRGCVSGAGPLGGNLRGRAGDLAVATHRDLSGWRVYLCGNPDMVQAAKKACYLFGAKLADIHADPFELRDLRQQSRAADGIGKPGPGAG